MSLWERLLAAIVALEMSLWERLLAAIVALERTFFRG
jgi:hypothetical protein